MEADQGYAVRRVNDRKCQSTSTNAIAAAIRFSRLVRDHRRADDVACECLRRVDPPVGVQLCCRVQRGFGRLDNRRGHIGKSSRPSLLRRRCSAGRSFRRRPRSEQRPRTSDTVTASPTRARVPLCPLVRKHAPTRLSSAPLNPSIPRSRHSREGGNLRGGGGAAPITPKRFQRREPIGPYLGVPAPTRHERLL